jgi:hypothetical protein
MFKAGVSQCALRDEKSPLRLKLYQFTLNFLVTQNFKKLRLEPPFVSEFLQQYFTTFLHNMFRLLAINGGI